MVAWVSTTDAAYAVVGLDNGGTSTNATVLHSTGRYLVDHLVEPPRGPPGGQDEGGAVGDQVLDDGTVGGRDQMIRSDQCPVDIRRHQ